MILLLFCSLAISVLVDKQVGCHLSKNKNSAAPPPATVRAQSVMVQASTTEKTFGLVGIDIGGYPTLTSIMLLNSSQHSLQHML